MLRYPDIEKSENGQGLVEFMIVIPIMLAALIMALEISWLCMNSISLSEAAYGAANDNTKAYWMAAEKGMEKYLEDYYSHFDDSRMQVGVKTGLQEYYYNDYVWKSRQQKYWQVPMRFQTLKTEVLLEYDLPCLTFLGTALLHGPVHIKASATAYRVMDHSVVK